MDPAVVLHNEGFARQKILNEATAPGNSEIQQFYSGLTLFLTGGTGFIGKQLIEKLFRSCEIKKAFVLIRKKKGKATQERLRDILDDPVFESVRKIKPYFEERIVAVEGDVVEIGLGISDKDWKKIIEEVDVIFHVAATIRFDETLRIATIINIRGTRETLKLGKACKKLKSFVHVSTAYTHTTSGRFGGHVMEQFYDCPIRPEVMIDLAESVDSARLESFCESLIKGWPNTYTFTKAIAEELIRTESGHLRVAVVRPSIVFGCYIEPAPGWHDESCVYGPSGIILGVGLGITRLMLVNSKFKLSFVPVDYVNNATIAAGWYAAVKPTNDIQIYNISSTNCGVTFNNISTPMRGVCREVQTIKSIWYCLMVETDNRVMYWIYSWFLHYIPAYFVDTVMAVFKIKKPKGLKSFVHIYRKYDKLVNVFSYFTTHEWNFDETNLISLSNRMSVTDRQIYSFDIKGIDWEWYVLMCCVGMRKYIIKDGLKDTEKAIKKQFWFKIANYVVLIVYLYVSWLVIKLLCKLFM